MGLFGFKNKGPSFEEKEQKVEKKAFEPMDLNAENITKLADLCGADKNSKFVYNIIFFQRKLGFPEDALPITFDADIIDENAPTIFYLFGQLYTVHNNFHTLPVKDAAKKYDKTWGCYLDYISNFSVFVSKLYFDTCSQGKSPA